MPVSVRLTILLVSVLACISPPVFAGSNDPLMALDNSLDISIQRSHLNYAETDDAGAYLDSEGGNTLGERIALTGMNTGDTWNAFTQLSYWKTEGNVGYTGAYLMSGAPVTGTSGANIEDYQVKLGSALPLGNRALFIPYASFGGHRWARTVGKGTIGEYVETYTHQYWTLGILWQYAAGARLAFTLNTAAGRTISPHISVPAVGVDVDLGADTLAELGLDADYRFRDNWHVFAGVDYLRYRYGHSTVVPSYVLGSYVMEPDSKTELINYNVGLRWSF